MINALTFLRNKRIAALALSIPLAIGIYPLQTLQAANETAVIQQVSTTIIGAHRLNPTSVEILFSDSQRMTFDFYGENIFRVFKDNNGGIIREPKAKYETHILVENPRRPVGELALSTEGDAITISSSKVKVVINKKTSAMMVTDLKTNKVVIKQLSSVEYDKNKISITLKENPGEYFYGGGVQNGRFSHKGTIVAIENQNSWTDGGVASPNPFYWSTNGYGVMPFTFAKGTYDFGATKKGEVILSHETDYLDCFFMVDQKPADLLSDFYQLTGNPALLPKFGFYEGHLNAYNRDYWKETDNGGIPFEDGKSYKESQKDNGGIKESLNGEKDNYQFSARAVIDRYASHDMPLGWILPNDGYGAGYGQTSTLDGNVQNLKEFGDYARKNGVQIGLWTQSNLHPAKGVSALLQRDIVKEIRDAGVRVLKTDVAWVGAGYSFGLHGVSDVGNIMPYYGNDARPFIISLDGWAGTQRYAAIWSGDQTGGLWEYIRFHIPTYIGSGLSGQPNICSDMDGIFGGKHPVINMRDFEWKAFSMMQLNMDGWGSNPKYPFILGEPAASVNRMYLKTKSALLPYTYSVAHAAVDGKPIIRAMFLDYPNDYTHGIATQYQYMYGPNFLVAPIYKETEVDEEGNDIRNNIYLPEGSWIDYFNGQKYEGNCVLNNFDAPYWKLPLFVKNGAIIPMTEANNHVNEVNKKLRIYELYPAGYSIFTEYNDDGQTKAYINNECTYTTIESNVDKKSNVLVTIHPTKGSFKGFEQNKVTEFKINVTAMPKKVSAKIGKKSVKLEVVDTKDAFKTGINVCYYDKAPNLNEYATKGSPFANKNITKNPQLLVKLASTDVTANKTILEIKGFEFNPVDLSKTKVGSLQSPSNIHVAKENKRAYSLVPEWDKVVNADYYEIEFNGMIYTHITENKLFFERLVPETTYTFKIRSINKDGSSQWKAFDLATSANPLEFAIKGIKAVCSAPAQGGDRISNLFDFDEKDVWHTKWGQAATPFSITADLRTVNVLDEIVYYPRTGGGNGVLQIGNISYSKDKIHWTKAGRFNWIANGQKQTFKIDGKPSARYIKIDVRRGVGKYGSGSEMYIFKVPGSKSYLQGDINHDGKIDNNDLMSYTNYTGLRLGDSDFEGYISKGDINKNNLIDAYDISIVATQLEDVVRINPKDTLAGTLTMISDKKSYKAGDDVYVTVTGKDMKAVNALSFAIPYNETILSYVSVEAKEKVKGMNNLTYDRLHSDGEKVLYPTFVNVGNERTLEDDAELFVLKFKANKDFKFNLKAEKGMFVDKNLNILNLK